MIYVLLSTVLLCVFYYYLKFTHIKVKSKGQIIFLPEETQFKNRFNKMLFLNFDRIGRFHNLAFSGYVFFVTCICVYELRLNDYCYILLLFISCFFHFLVENARSRGEYAYSLYEGLDLGFIDEKTVSLHLSKNDLFGTRVLLNGKLLKWLNAMGVENVVFKSYLLHPDCEGGQERMEYLSSKMSKNGWDIQSSKTVESEISFLTKFALFIRLTVPRFWSFLVNLIPDSFRKGKKNKTISVDPILCKKEFNLYFSVRQTEVKAIESEVKPLKVLR